LKPEAIQSCIVPHTWEGEQHMNGGTVDLLQGTLDVLILRTLAWQRMHGYAVTRWIRERTEGTIEIEDAPLYKALHRLERAGCVSAEWGVSENNRRARYYKLTPAGRQRLKTEEQAWRRYAGAVLRVLEPA
jgi:PadR family transcriptional regulator PadR